MKFIEENIVLIITLTLFVLSIVFWVMYQCGMKDFNAFSFYAGLTAFIFFFTVKLTGLWKSGK
jgi:hypothetical protein